MDVTQSVDATIGKIQDAANFAINSAEQSTNDLLKASAKKLELEQEAEAHKEEGVRKWASAAVRDASENARDAVLADKATKTEGGQRILGAKRATEVAIKAARNLAESEGAVAAEDQQFASVEDAERELNRQLAAQKLNNDKAVRLEKAAAAERIQKREVRINHSPFPYSHIIYKMNA